MELKEGIYLEQEKIVLESETADKIGSGGLEVFSTPILIAFMENTAYKLVQSSLDEGKSTVGIAINIEHLKANLIGDKLVCNAKLEKIDGKKLTFAISVKCEEQIVGKGTHIRYIIDSDRFMENLKNR